LLEFHQICYDGNAIQGDLKAIIFNPIIIIMNHFKNTDSNLLGEPCSTMGLDCLCSMATKLFTVGNYGTKLFRAKMT
jgi:hypothetical protein